MIDFDDRNEKIINEREKSFDQFDDVFTTGELMEILLNTQE